MAGTTVRFVIARVGNIPGVFHLEEIVMPDAVQLPVFTRLPNGNIVLSNHRTMPFVQAAAHAQQYIDHEGEPVAVNLHHYDGTIKRITLSGLHIASAPVKRVVISDHSRKFVVEVGLQVPV